MVVTLQMTPIPTRLVIGPVVAVRPETVGSGRPPGQRRQARWDTAETVGRDLDVAPCVVDEFRSVTQVCA